MARAVFLLCYHDVVGVWAPVHRLLGDGQKAPHGLWSVVMRVIRMIRVMRVIRVRRDSLVMGSASWTVFVLCVRVLFGCVCVFGSLRRYKTIVCRFCSCGCNVLWLNVLEKAVTDMCVWW